MTPRTTPEQRAAANELLAAVAARLGASFQRGAVFERSAAFVGDTCVAVAGAKVVVLSVAGFDGHTVIEAMPAAFRTPNGKPSQVWEIVGFIAERMAERVRRAPEMEALAAKAGPSRAPGETHYSDGSEVPCG